MTKIDKTNWPEYIRDFRKRNCLTQAELANYLQVSKRNVENWEEGFSIPPPYLKKALGNIEKNRG